MVSEDPFIATVGKVTLSLVLVPPKAYFIKYAKPSKPTFVGFTAPPKTLEKVDPVSGPTGVLSDLMVIITCPAPPVPP
jgi:hypothetical protein